MPFQDVVLELNGLPVLPFFSLLRDVLQKVVLPRIALGLGVGGGGERERERASAMLVSG